MLGRWRGGVKRAGIVGSRWPRRGTVRAAHLTPLPSPLRRRCAVVRYLMLVKYTETGVAQIHNATRRAEWFRKWAGQLGVTVESMYWLVGEYDVVVIATAAESAPVVALM